MQRIFYTLILFFAFGSALNAQTILVDSTGAGGFENGTDFAANGWTVVNSTGSASPTNKWYVGTIPTGFTNNAAYVSSTGSAWEYTNNSISVVHFYRDITLPAGETDITLSFKWKAQGETGFWDALMVGIAPVSVTPAATTTSLGQNLPANITNLGSYWLSSATTNRVEMKLSSAPLGNCNAPVTVRLVFTWKNDGSGGTNPPAAVDDISVISAVPPTPRLSPAGGVYTIDKSLPNTGNNFTTFTEAINSLNDLTSGCSPRTGGITFNVPQGQVFNEILPPLTGGGTSAFPVVFQKTGTGPNPKIERTDAGSLTTSSMGGQGDAVLIIQGSDYLTFDAIDLNATNAGIEYGLLVRKSSGVDGAQHVTYQNSKISLTRPTSGTPYTTGVYISNLDPTSAVSSATGTTVTAPSGRNENILIAGNTITSVFYGVQVRGYAAASPYTLYDSAVYIGKPGAGNIITNFGGFSTTANYGIYFLQVNDAVVSHNTINNTADGGASSTGTMYGIYGSTGTTATLKVTNNNISLTSGYTSGALYGLYNSSYTGNLTVNSDTISLNNTVNSSGTFAHIYNGSATAATAVSFNDNVLYNSTYSTTGTSYIIYNSVTNNSLTTAMNNTIYNITKTGNSALYVYYNLSSPTGTEVFANNQVYSISNAANALYGYYCNTSSSHKRSIFGNTIYNLSCGNTLYAIFKALGTSNIYKNKIYDLTTTATGSIVAGIYISSGNKDSVYNNIIGDLKATAYSGANGVIGIYTASTTATSTIGIYYNTILLNASSTGANFGTSGIYLTTSATATSAAAELKNNLVINNSTASGTGKTVVLRRSSAALNNFATSTNNNLYYTAAGAIFYDGTNEDLTMNEYKSRVSPRETASISESPTFVSTTGSDATYLHVNTTIPTQVESGGVPVEGITDDFDGNTRNVATPDIGADEFAGVSADLTGPAITFTALPVRSICISGQTITATINDPSGVNVAAGTKPRLWFKKANELDVLPATNTSASNGWKYVEASNSSSPFTFTFDFSLLTSPLTGSDSVSYFIVAQDLAGTPNFGVNAATFASQPTSVALGSAAFPVSGTVNGFSILVPPSPIAIQVSRAEVCLDQTVILDIDGIETIGGELQWQSSPMGANTWTDIPGATTAPYTTDELLASTDFRLVIKCGGTPISSSPSAAVTVIVNNPTITSSTGATRCGPGELTLSATSPGYDVNWYATPTDITPIHTGDVFTTPSLTATTTYYVSASTGGGSEPAGRTTYTATPNTIGNDWGLVFNVVNAPILLSSVDIYAVSTAGSITVVLTDNTGAVLQTAGPFAYSGGSTTSPTMVRLPLNLTIPVGTGYRLLSAATSGGALIRETSGISYPYTSPSGNVVITSGYISGTTLTTYYWFYNWQISTGCEGTRVPVTASIVSPPAITTSVTPAAVCEGESANLGVSSANAGYTFTWTPGNLNGTSVNVTPASTTKYYVNAVDNSGGTYNGCANIDSVTVTVNPKPPAITIAPSPAEICAGGDAVALAVTSGGSGTSLLLSEDFNGSIPDWTTINTSSGTTPSAAAWTLRQSPYTPGGAWTEAMTSNDNSQFILTNSDAVGSGAVVYTALTSPAFSTVGYTSCELQFYHYFRARLASEARLSISTNGSTWTTLRTYTGTNEGNYDAFALATVNLDAYLNNATVYLRFEFDGGWDWGWALDNVTVTGVNPTSVTWSPATGLYTDATATTPYVAGTALTSVYAKPATTTLYTVTSTSTSGCANSTTINVAVTTPPAATIAYPGSPYCNTGTATVVRTGSAGGSYSAPNGLSINSLSGEIDLAASTPGTYTVTYSIAASGGCGLYTATTSVIINAAPSATITYTGSPYCTGGTTATVTHSGSTGGTYSSTAGLVIDPVTGAIDLAASTIGTYTVTYTIPAANGCAVYTTTTSVTLATTPSATISYGVLPYCTNAGMATVTQTGSTGGTYSSTTGLSIDPSTGTIDLGASTPGTYTVTYSIAAGSGCTAFSTTASVTINAAPTATIAYAGSPYCSNAGTATVTLTGSTGGTYSAAPAGLSLNTSTGAINLGTSTPGTYTVTYTIPAANGCLVFTTTTSITITALPTATISYPGSPYCNTSSTATVNLTGATGGTFSSTAGLSIDATTGTVDIATSTVGNYVVTYTIPAGNGCATVVATANVSIVTPASASISYPASPYCTNGGTASVTLTGTTGGNFTSTFGLSVNATTGEINLGASLAGTYTVTYTVPAATGCPAFSTSTSVTITAAPVATISYAGSPFCSNGAPTANVTRTGATGGTFSSTTGLTLNPTTGQINIATSTPGTYTVSYTVTGGSGCADLVATTSVVITPAPSATITYSGSPYCSGAGTATVTHTGSTGGTYSSTVGLSLDPTTGEVNLGASVAGTYLVSYTIPAGNGCAAYTANTSITITAVPNATISYANSPYCGNGTVANVTRTGTAGGTYSSTTGLSINATTGAINLAASTPGTYTVTYSLAANGSCAAFSTTTSVTITAAPAATISYAGSPYCSNAGTANVTRTGTAGGTYSSTAGLAIDATTGAIDLAASTAGTYTVTYTIAASGGCDVYTATASVTVTAGASATISYAGSPYCGSTGVAVVTHTGTPGGTYSSTAGLSLDPATGAINIAGSTPGTYTVTYTVPGGNGCSVYTTTATVMLTTPGTWTGAVSTDWNNPANWCGGIPSSATDAIIPGAVANMPNLSNGSGAARNVVLETGATLTIGTAGTLDLYGNMTGGGTLNAANGSLGIRGTTDQSILPFTTTNLTMNMGGAGASLVLGGNSAVTGNLTLSNGNIRLDANNLSLGTSSTGKPTSHIITNASGNVIVVNLASSQNRTVPIGSDAATYNPVAITANAGHTPDNFSVRVQSGVYENGTSGSMFQRHVTDRMWIISEGAPGGSDVNLVFQWSGAQELPEFNRTKSYVMQYTGNDWVAGTSSAALGADPFTQTKNNVTSFGAFAVQTQPIPRPITGIYPNPASEYINVVTDLLSTGPVVFAILNDQGQVVYRHTETLTVGLNQTRLNISHLASGVYFIRVSTRLNEKFLVQRFVKMN